jgi:hypothetical protein
MADLVSIEPENSSADVVATLERVLKKAEAGELSSVAVAYVYRNSVLGCVWSTIPSVGMILGAVRRLDHRLNNHFDGDVVDGAE